MSLLHPCFWVIEKHFWPTTNACSCHLHISLYPYIQMVTSHDSLIQKALNRDSLRYVSCWEILSKDSNHHFCCWKWSPFVGFKSSVAGAILVVALTTQFFLRSTSTAFVDGNLAPRKSGNEIETALRTLDGLDGLDGQHGSSLGYPLVI